LKELRELNIEAQSFVADVTDLAALKQAIQAAKNEFGSIDVHSAHMQDGINLQTCWKQHLRAY
jgi:NADP-dependent 3-hydroxy acid dehydrogenase YdfG